MGLLTMLDIPWDFWGVATAAAAAAAAAATLATATMFRSSDSNLDQTQGALLKFSNDFPLTLRSTTRSRYDINFRPNTACSDLATSKCGAVVPGRCGVKSGSKAVGQSDTSGDFTRRAQHKDLWVDVCVVGGGAAGMFAAIAAARAGAQRVVVIESGSRVLTKVSISGGGRCNVMHNDSIETDLLLASYPRGHNELRSPLTSGTMTPSETRQWFEAQGVSLKVEPDGRVFPTSDKSETIITALTSAATDAGVAVWKSCPVSNISPLWASAEGRSIDSTSTTDGLEMEAAGFLVRYSNRRKLASNGKTASESRVGENAVGSKKVGGKQGADMRSEEGELRCRAVVVATGSAVAGHRLASKLGHTIVEPTPSLFSFRLPGLKAGAVDRQGRSRLQDDAKGGANGGVFRGLAGLSFQDVSVTLELSGGDGASDSNRQGRGRKGRGGGGSPVQIAVKERGAQQRGPMLVTHKGLSGPAVLRLSSYAARPIAQAGYRGELIINFLPDTPRDSVVAALEACRTSAARRQIVAHSPFPSNLVPRRMWEALVRECGGAGGVRWAEASGAMVEAITCSLTSLGVCFDGRDTNKDEFVTAGGVLLSEVNMSTLESKVQDGLFFAGECLDIDGVTGGFNFQSCWTTGHAAGTNAGLLSGSSPPSSSPQYKG